MDGSDYNNSDIGIKCLVVWGEGFELSWLSLLPSLSFSPPLLSLVLSFPP